MKAWELLSGPEKWTQGAAARDVEGNKVDARDEKAVAWCMVGAIIKCYEDRPYDKVSQVAETIRMWPPARWSDAPERKYEEVVAALRKADV